MGTENKGVNRKKNMILGRNASSGCLLSDRGKRRWRPSGPSPLPFSLPPPPPIPFDAFYAGYRDLDFHSVSREMYCLKNSFSMLVNTYHINNIYCIDGENPKADRYFNRPACQSINQLINHSINDFGIRHSVHVVPKNDTICSIIL